MANHSEMALDVIETSTDKKRAVLKLWQSVAKYEGNRGRWSTLTKKIVGLHRKFLSIWNKVFMISCVVAVSLDPLFLYIPIIDEDMKCLILEKKLKAIAVASRSLTDCFYCVDILIQILAIAAKSPSGNSSRPSNGKNSVPECLLAIAKRIFHPYILVDVFAVLPIPQVAIFNFISKMDSRSLETWKFLNAIVLLQYVPRLLRIFLLCNERHLIPRNAAIWIKSVFNFFLYILASHILGAIWYYFSIQRETACWRYAYQSKDEYELSSFDCDDRHAFRNITLLNGLCPIEPNPKLFNFGVFTDARVSGMLRSTDFPQKFMICFWWGLRNLSSLGQNLQPSAGAWENLFAVSISTIGLLLFLYLIGNLQTYLQFATVRAEEIRRETKKKDKEVDRWLSGITLPRYLKEMIMKMVERKIEENEDVQVENILSLLPPEQSNIIQLYMRLVILKKVPMLQRMDDRVLKEIFEYLTPRTYNENECIMEEGIPLAEVIFIREGIVRTYRTQEGDGGLKINNYKVLEKGSHHGVYGEELLHWVSNFANSSPSGTPKSRRNVRSVRKVEVFALSAENLEIIVAKYWWHFSRDKSLYYYNELQLDQLKKFAASAIEKRIRRLKKNKED